MTDKLRAAAQQALEAMQENWRTDKSDAAITALRAALAEPEPRNQCAETCERAKLCAVCAGGLTEQPPEQEPAIRCTYPLCKTTAGCSGVCSKAVPYTAPQPAKREPLTDEEIYECERLAAIRYQRHKYSIRGQQITPADDPQWHFARAIEAKLREKNT